VQHVPLAVTLQACEAHDLTGPEFDRMPQRGNRLAGDAGQNTPLAGGAGRMTPSGSQGRARLPAHGLDEALHGGRLHGSGPGQAPVAERHDPGGDLEDFLEFMADEDEGDTLGRPGLDEGAQLPAALGVEGGCRLVENQQPEAGVAGRPRDLDHLPLADGQVAHLRIRVDAMTRKHSV
jgi:hypothetical protein